MAAPHTPHDDKSRKRSRIVLLSLMGAGAGAVLLAELLPSRTSVPAGMFQDVDTCVNSGRYDQATCTSAFAEAERHHIEHAPRFTARADCEADFAPGSCEPLRPTTADSGTLFAPVMAGVLIGGALGAAGAAGQPALQPVYRSCSATPQDNCQTSSGGGGGGHGGLYTCSGYRVGSSYGTTRVEPAAFSTVRPTTLSRGGFGSRARAMSASS
jgi:uncharacterized protein YgiB involved in biofilm formation